jgi:hypothetical protein
MDWCLDFAKAVDSAKSPRTTGPTPSGVPVIMRSPGASIIDSDKGNDFRHAQISFDISESCFTTPFTANHTLGWMAYSFHRVQRRDDSRQIESHRPS